MFVILKVFKRRLIINVDFDHQHCIFPWPNLFQGLHLTLSFPKYCLKTWDLLQMFCSNAVGCLSLEPSNSIITLAILFHKLLEWNSHLPFYPTDPLSAGSVAPAPALHLFFLPWDSSNIIILDPILELQHLVFSCFLSHLHPPSSGRSGVQTCPEMSSLLRKGFLEEYIQLLISSNSKPCQDLHRCCLFWIKMLFLRT